jgi:hypothetical protein
LKHVLKLKDLLVEISGGRSKVSSFDYSKYLILERQAHNRAGTPLKKEMLKEKGGSSLSPYFEGFLCELKKNFSPEVSLQILSIFLDSIVKVSQKDVHYSSEETLIIETCVDSSKIGQYALKMKHFFQGIKNLFDSIRDKTDLVKPADLYGKKVVTAELALSNARKRLRLLLKPEKLKGVEKIAFEIIERGKTEEQKANDLQKNAESIIEARKEIRYLRDCVKQAEKKLEGATYNTPKLTAFFNGILKAVEIGLSGKFSWFKRGFKKTYLKTDGKRRAGSNDVYQEV